MEQEINYSINSSDEVDFTITELQKWIQAGLLDPILLSPDKNKELVDFVHKNKPLLYSCFRENRNDLEMFPHSVTLPSPNDMTHTFELQVVDRRTGKVVNTMQKIAKIKLFDGLDLHVSAKELDEWLQVTERLKTLTKEQENLFLSKIATDGKDAFSKENIISLVEEIRKKRRSGKVRHAGHFTDSKLQNSPAKPLLPETHEKIESLKVKTYGIRLTPSEDKLMNAIYKLLHEKSENSDTTSDQFYAGNETAQLVPYGSEGTKYKSATLRIKPAELYKEYLGKDEYSGKEIANIKQTLFSLCEKKFLIQYDRKREVHNGKKRPEILTDRIEDVQSLIHVMSYIEGMSEKEVKRLDSGDQTVREQKGELILALNPFLTDQIKSKYVLYPPDINQRTMIASGGALHVTESIIILRDYMLREISAKRFNPPINEETLIDQLRLTSYAKSGRKKRVIERINGAIDACKKLGIILEVKIETGSQGQRKYLFTLDPNFA